MENLLRRLICLLAIGALGWPVAMIEAAEKKDTRPVLDPPPPALPQTVTVPRGRRLEIPLRIYGVQSEALRYIIKTPPAHGKLSEPRVVSREVSAVVYEPPADYAVTADRFSYAVQNHAGVSAPVEVTISIVDQPPRLAVPHTIEFGEQLAGSTTTREIEVANRGGGLVEGEVQVDPPFSVEGRRTYRLEGGDYTYFKIVFTPTEGGLFRREIRYTSDREFVTSLVGSSQTPISAEPAKIDLRNAPDSAVRTGAFEIVNRTGEELKFQLKTSPRLQVPESVTVAAHARVAIAVSTRAEDVADLDEEVRVESAGFSLRVPTRAFRVGAILRLPQRAVALGRIDATRGAQATVDLQNVGGTPAKVTAEIGAPFVLSESAFEIGPGITKRLTLTVQPGPPKRYRTWLKFKAGLNSTEMEVDAELMGDATASRGEQAAKPKPTVNPADLPPWMPDLNFAKTIRVTAVTSTSAKLEWPVEMNGAAQFRIDRLILTRDSARELRNAWVEIPKTTFAKQGPLWVAALTGLTPRQSQTVRVVPLNSDGKAGRELFRLDFNTPPGWSVPKPRLIPTLLVALLVTLGVLFWRRLRVHAPEPVREKSVRVGEFERIALRPFRKRT